MYIEEIEGLGEGGEKKKAKEREKGIKGETGKTW